MSCPLFCENMCRAADCLCSMVSTDICRTAKAAFQIGRNQLNSTNTLYARCFGYFEIFHNGIPLHFGRKQTKELVAFLIDRKGANCTSEEIACALWDDSIDSVRMKHLLRNLVMDLRNALKAAGFDHLLIRSRDKIALNVNEIKCDYYDFLAGKADTGNSFRGEYMEQYSWSETTKGTLIFGNTLV